MKKKKGFTLVELLAAVVILGIIISVATIAINRISKNAKIKAGLVSAKNYVTAVETKFMLNEEKGLKRLTYKSEEVKDVIDGKGPTNGIMTIYNDHVVQANLYINGFSYSCFGSNCSYNKDADYSSYVINDDNQLVGQKYDDGSIGEISYENGLIGFDHVSKEYEEYVEYEKTASEEDKKKLGYVPDKLETYPEEKLVQALDNMYYGTSIESNEEGYDTSSFPSKFDLRDIDGVTSVKDQYGLGLCWAYAGAGAVESVAKRKLGLELDLSERQLDYFSSGNGIKGMTKGYSWINSELGDGSSNYISMYSLFSGLTLQTKNKFYEVSDKNTKEENKKNNKILSEPELEGSELTQKDISKVINKNAMEYYVSEAMINEYTKYELKLTKNYTIEQKTYLEYKKREYEIKKHLQEYGGVAVNICVWQSEVLKGKTLYGKPAEIIYYDGSEPLDFNTCGLHVVLITGWDDSIIYTDPNGRTHKGAWIFKNSWGSNYGSEGYYYLVSDYTDGYVQVSTDSAMYIKDVKKTNKEYENTYDSMNNFPLNKFFNYYAIVNTYIDKVDDVKESIQAIGMYNTIQIKTDTINTYFVEVNDASECSSIKYDELSKNFNSLLSENKINGFSYVFDATNVGGLSDKKYFRIDDINIENTFEKDICVVLPTKLNGKIETKIYTKQLSDKNTPMLESNYVKYENKYYIDTNVANIESGARVDVEIYDENGKRVYNSVEITDNYVLNNVAHIEINVPDTSKKYIVKTKIGNKYADGYIVLENETGQKVNKNNNACRLSVDNYYPVISSNDLVTLKVICDEEISNDNNELISKVNFSDNEILSAESVNLYESENGFVYEYKLKPLKKGSTEVMFDQRKDEKDLYDKVILDEKIYVLNEKKEVSCYFSKPNPNQIMEGYTLNVKLTCVGSDIIDISEEEIKNNILDSDINSHKKEVSVKKTKATEDRLEFIVSITANSDDEINAYLRKGVVKNKYGNSSNLASVEIIKIITSEKEATDEKRPKCSLRASNSEVAVDDIVTFTLECNDKYGNLKLDKNKITVPKHLIFFERIEVVDVSDPKVVGTDAYYEIKVKGKNLGKTKLLLDDKAVTNKYGFTSKAIESSEIKVKAKPLLNGCN